MTITWLRTPEENFANLEGYPFKPNYLEIPFEGQQVRMHYVDERPADGKWSGETIVLLHGQPTWSYLYRKMIPLLLAAGHRVIAPDLIGFGKSDKPSRPHDISYGRQEEWMRAALFDVLDLKDVNLFCQDWGGLIGLRLVAFHPERFMRVVISNTGLPVGGKDSNFTPGDAPRKTMMLVGVKIWQQVAKRITAKMIGGLCGKLCRHINLTDAEKAGYCAPFPSKEFLSGPRAMPQHIPTDPTTESSKRSREAWDRLAKFDKPFLCAFSDKDDAARMLPVGEHFQKQVPGTKGQRHRTIMPAGHYVQEDQPEQTVQAILDVISDNPKRRAALPGGDI
jgi:haloalkane dehalogenase